MDNLYKNYLKEREGLEVLENELGFCTYKYREDNSCYIQDIYVVPNRRKSGIASQLADTVAKEAKAKGYNILIGSVDFKANLAKQNDQVLKAYGMKPYTVEGSLVYYSKEI